MKINLKERKGITLIALIITIVILLILAGVALNIALGDNGIFKKSKDAGDRYAESSAREKLELALTDLQMEKTQNANIDSTNYLTSKDINIIDDETVEVDGYMFTVDMEKLKITGSAGKYTGEEYNLIIRHYLESSNDTSYVYQENKTTTVKVIAKKIKLESYATTIAGGKYIKGSLTENGQEVTETRITSDTTIYLYYSANAYELKVNKVEKLNGADTSGIINITGEGNYKAGQTVTLTAVMETAQAGYDYTFKWKDGTGELGTNLTYQFTMPANDYEITAEATKTIKTYTVTCEDRLGNATGTLLGSSTRTYNHGDEAKGSHWGTTRAGYNYKGETSAQVTGPVTVYRFFSETAATAAVGTLVQYGGENFYKVGSSSDGSKIYLLSKYNINSNLVQSQDIWTGTSHDTCVSWAESYGAKFGNGVTGRLWTKTEAEANKSLWTLERNKASDYNDNWWLLDMHSPGYYYRIRCLYGSFGIADNPMNASLLCRPVIEVPVGNF